MAAQYGRFRVTIINPATGLPVVGAGVEIRKQGATVNGLHAGLQTVFTVNDPGAIVVASGDQVAVGISASSLGVTGVTATQVTVAGPGFTDVADDSRLTVTNNLPTLFNDAQGAETKSNPLTTDANGLAECWLPLERFDYAIRPTGPAGAVTILYQDMFPEGTGRVIFHDFAGSATAQLWKSLRLFSTTDKFLEIQNSDGTVQFSIAGDGQITIGKSGATPGHTINGNTNHVGTFAVSGGSITTSGGFSHTGGSFAIVAGSITTSMLAANAVVVTRTADGSADTALTAGGAYVDVPGATITFTPASTSSEIVIIANCPMEANAAAVGIGFAALTDGSGGTVFSEDACIQGGASAGNPVPTHMIYRVTGLSGSQTFKLRAKCTVANMRVNDATNAAAKRVSRIVIMEFKK